MLVTKQIINIEKYLKKYENIEYRIINNTVSKNMILLNSLDIKILEEVSKELLENFGQFIQEVILEPNEAKDDFIIQEIKRICNKNSVAHRNISYINWTRKSKTKKFKNVIAGYSFKGGMGRSTTLAYLSYFYYLLGKKIVVLDCDFEAPGIASIFFNKEKREQKAGVLDYFIDLNIEDKPQLNNYFLQSEVSDRSGNLYLFPSGIDFDIDNYLNKISKIDFNSTTYTNSFTKLLNHINELLKPDLIFIDLRAGINESNGLILKNISNTNLLFFNNEAQNEDGLRVISSLFNNSQNSYIMNSTIRFYNPEIKKLKEEQLTNFLTKKLNFKEFIDIEDGEDSYQEKRIIPIPHNSSMLENSYINEYQQFVKKEYKSYITSSEAYIKDVIEIINRNYFNREKIYTKENKKIDKSSLTDILGKLKDVFEIVTGTDLFKKSDDLKYFYLKDDISKIVNEQIFLILGAKGSGKSALFRIFTQHHKDILSRLNIEDNKYIEGFSKSIMNEISKDYTSNLFKKSDKKSDVERFWKCWTLFLLEKELHYKNKLLIDIDEISEKFSNVEVGLEVDRRLKNINIELLKIDRVITLVYDELDIGFTKETEEIFITTLISFWQDNIYKYSQIRSKTLLRNDIYKRLEIENKTHLELNSYELMWNEKEIFSLILKIFIAKLDDNELDTINLLFILKNRKNGEVIEDMDKIIEAIYLIFSKKAPYSSTMDKWLIRRLSDSKGLITPRTVYKLMFESIKNELLYMNIETKKGNSSLLNNFRKDWEKIFKEVSKQKLTEYKAEFKGYDKIYNRIKNIGQRTFTKEEFKTQYSKNTRSKTIESDLEKLIGSGFIGYDLVNKRYQVAFIYVYYLELKINRSKGGKGRK